MNRKIEEYKLSVLWTEAEDVVRRYLGSNSEATSVEMDAAFGALLSMRMELAEKVKYLPPVKDGSYWFRAEDDAEWSVGRVRGIGTSEPMVMIIGVGEIRMEELLDLDNRIIWGQEVIFPS